MKPDTKAQFVKYRLFFLAFGGFMTLASGFALFFPPSDSIALRLASSVTCLATGAVCFLIGIRRISKSTCLNGIFIANMIVFFAAKHGERVQRQEQWSAIYHKVSELQKTEPFPIEKFGSFLSETLRSGSILSFGINVLWILNLLTLMYLVRTAKDRRGE